MVYLPFIGGVSLLYVCYQVIVSGGSTAIPDIVVLASGIPLYIVMKLRIGKKVAFFNQPKVSYDTIDALD